MTSASTEGMQPSAVRLDASPELWPGPPPQGGYNAMRVIPGTGPAKELVEVIETNTESSFPRTLGEEIRAAVHAVRALDSNQRLGIGYQSSEVTIAALTALQNLVRSLSEYAEDDVTLRPLVDYLHDPPELLEELRCTISAYLAARMGDDLQKLASFSLILFRQYDLDGAIVASLVGERDQWRTALRPEDRARTDYHLAIIPPPTATDAIMRLAEQLSCRDLLPCVVFLGHKPDLSTPGTVLTKWSARRLVKPGLSIPQQLQVCYRSVYKAGIPGKGTLLTAAADKFTTVIRAHLDMQVASALVAGAVGGSSGIDAVHTLFQLFGK